MRMHWRMAVAALSLGLLGSGCVSISQVQTADTLGAGKFQVGLEPGVQGLLAKSEGATGSLYYPHVDLSVRYGVSDRVDLGARVGSSLAELQGKFLFTDPTNPTLAVSLAPSLGGVFIGSGDSGLTYLNLGIPLLVGFKTSGGSEFVIGPRLTATRIGGGTSASSSSANVLSGGASIGYALRVTEGFRLMPEVAVAYPFLGATTSTGSESTVSSGFNAGFVQFKLGFLFGQGRPTMAAMTGSGAVNSMPVE